MAVSLSFSRQTTLLFFAIISASGLVLFLYLNLLAGEKSYAFSVIDSSKCPNRSLDLEYIEKNLNDLDQADPQLIEYTRIKYLNPPLRKPYNLHAKSTKTLKRDSAEWILKNFFGDTTNGIFLEVGANDGETDTNTLYLEKELGWTGLLIECNGLLAPPLMTKHRKAWFVNACLSPTSTPGIYNLSIPLGLNFNVAATLGKPLDRDLKYKRIYFDVQAIPLYTIIAALGGKKIDIFSFDIEGMELGILRIFPFDKVTFKIIMMETQYYNPVEMEEVFSIYAKNGYLFIQPFGNDHVFVHNSVKHIVPGHLWPRNNRYKNQGAVLK